MLHVCVVKFDVMRNVKKFVKYFEKQGLVQQMRVRRLATGTAAQGVQREGLQWRKAWTQRALC